ncbi:MAG: hypothetical protein LBB72_04100 [Spirochaetaceae bacterium]|jgi:hypothetical protein|nr:hypothetical protein [Spirochaetaceae bacterium]
METIFFAVLVPHRDCLPTLNDYRRRLFAAGFEGAWSFPAAAPLVRLSQPLDSGELKAAASELRSLLGNSVISPVTEGDGSNGKCANSEYSGSECAGWGPYRFFGVMLDLPPPAFPADAVLQRWEKPVLAPAILRRQAPLRCQAPRIIFRAAAIANLALTPVPPENTAEFASFEADYSYKWELGPLCWLPRARNGRTGH